MAKGASSKNVVFNKLIEVFPDSFWEDQGKILRIPLEENGEIVEIKVTLTAAKTNLGEGKSSAFELTDAPKDSAFTLANSQASAANPTSSTKEEDIELTKEEKENVRRLAEILGL